MGSIVIVNNYIETVNLEKEKIMKAFPGTDVIAFTDPILATKHIYNNVVKCVFTDIDIRPLNGFAFMRLLHKWNAKLPVFLVGDDEHIKAEVLRSDADGFFHRSQILDGSFLKDYDNYRQQSFFE